MHIALAMPNWITGIVGLVKTESEDKCRDACELIYYTCYIPEFDFVKIPVAKRGCTLRVLKSCIERNMFSVKLVYADPYRAVNELCTKYRVNRLQVVDSAYRAILKYLVKLGEISTIDDVIVDEELGQYLSAMLEIHQNVRSYPDSSCVKIAKLVASIPDVASFVSSARDRRRFRIGTEEIEIEILDIHDMILREVEDRIRGILYAN